MSVEAGATVAIAAQRNGIGARFLASQFFAVTVVVFVILVVWYVGAVFLNANAQRLFDNRDGITPTTIEFIEATWSQSKPRLPALDRGIPRVPVRRFTLRKLAKARAQVFRADVPATPGLEAETVVARDEVTSGGGCADAEQRSEVFDC